MRKNPRKQKTPKIVEEKVTSDSETSENSKSDDPKLPENKATEYEKQRELRIAQNKARIEDLGLRNIANSLMNLSQKGGKSKSNLNSRNGKDDDEYQPIHEDPKDDTTDSSLDSSSEEFEEQQKRRKKKQKKKVELDSRVVIPDSSLQFMGHCGEKICLTFPKGPKEEVKELMDCFPKGFNGFNREAGERALGYIAGLKADCWKLRRSYVIYPEFCEEVVEGLPFPDGFNGFNLEESKEISGVIVALINARSRLKELFQSYVQVSDRKSRSRKQKSSQKQLDTTDLMDEDEALKQAIALSLKDVVETSDMQHAGLSQSPRKQAVNANEKSYDHSREDNSRRKKRPFKNRVQMTEDDLVINFCQFDETGKGSITLRDLQRMAASHDFTWTDKELADMIRCFDSDKDGKMQIILSLWTKLRSIDGTHRRCFGSKQWSNS